jgi:hypothetical protein
VSALACPALFVAAPASGQGKTTVTAALARLHRRQGRRVRVFKCGPDFLDPQIHAVASGAPVYNLDLGMCGEPDAAWRLHQAAGEADLILVEGVMGLFDGKPSGADIARRFGIPVMAVIDAKAMAQTFGALVHGLATWQPDLPFSGVLANHVGSEGHARLLQDSLSPGMAWYGALPRDEAAALPERHLGILQAAEIADLDERLDRLADHLARTGAADLRLRWISRPCRCRLWRRCWRAGGLPSPGTPLSASFIRPTWTCCRPSARSWPSSRPWPTSRCRLATRCGCRAATRSSTPPGWPPTRAGWLACGPTRRRANRCSPNVAA